MTIFHFIEKLSATHNGCFETIEDQQLCEKTISYLLENFSEEEVTDILSETDIYHLNFNNLPEALWEESLLKKDQFYFHHLLQIKSRPTKYDKISNAYLPNKFFVEMKIRFTENDFVVYMYTTLQTAIPVRDIKRDIGTLHYLLKKYNSIDSFFAEHVEPIDYLLYLIEYVKSNHPKRCSYLSLLDIENNYSAVALEVFVNKTQVAISNKINKIIHR